jgi:RNA polymerase sigma factor (sigma-70 family)
MRGKNLLFAATALATAFVGVSFDAQAQRLAPASRAAYEVFGVGSAASGSASRLSTLEAAPRTGLSPKAQLPRMGVAGLADGAPDVEAKPSLSAAWTKGMKDLCADKASSSDISEFRQLVERKVRRSVWSVDVDTSQDLTQAILLKILEKCAELRNGSITNPGGYASTVTQNHTKDFGRKMRNQPAMETLESPSPTEFYKSLLATLASRDPNPEANIITRELLARSLLVMTPQQRKAFRMSFDGHSRAETATLMGISEERVKELLAEARRRARKDW